MERELVKKGMSTLLHTASNVDSLGQQNELSLSLYGGELDKKILGSEMLKLAVAFPDLPDVFFDVLAERIVKNGFTNERLQDAVSHLIDNFKYPRPSIADIIGYDKRIRLYTPSELTRIVANRESDQSDFLPHWIGDKLFWLKVTDCEMYNFKPNTKRKEK